MTRKWIYLSALAVLAISSITPNLTAQSAAASLEPFEKFRDGLRVADSYALMNRPEARVSEPAVLEEMRQHLLSLYADVQVTHSYQLDEDIYDCVPVEQQPSVRLQGITHIAEPPPPIQQKAAPDAVGAPLPTAQLSEERSKDRFGNTTQCEVKTIPMRRVTLDEITRFPSLRAFFAKDPVHQERREFEGSAIPCSGPTCGHKYSRTYQSVDNWGGNFALNVWSPHVDTSKGEVFSLSQAWYMGGSGSKLPGFQTVEVGWQNYPAKYGDQRSRLFIYYTADNYNNTGCYNLDCSAFVQTSNSVHLGGPFAHYSVSGGAQYEFTIQVQFYKGNWWMLYGGKAFGYYPKALYHGGQLSKHSTEVQHGTEGVGTTIWPPEGSGKWPSAGYRKAAYQRNIFYFKNSAIQSNWESPTPWITSPACYTIGGPHFSSSSGWGEYFYDGGPGGKGC